MNSIDDIYEFFDNALSPEQEASLFRHIAEDENLRAEFKTTLALENSVKSYRNSASPSLELGAGIMAAAGYGTPIPPAIPKVPIWKSAIQYSATILATAIGTFFIFTAMQNNNGVNSENLKQSAANNNKFNGPSSIETTKPIKKEDESKPISHEKTIVKYIYADAKANSNDEIETEYKPAENAEIKANSIAVLSNSQIAPNGEIRFDRANIAEIEHNNLEELTYLSDEFLSDFSVEYNNSLNWNFPKESISPKEYSKLNNMQFSLFYDVTEDLKIGASVRQETFFSRYEETDNRGRIYKVEMQPNITSYGLSVRYDVIDLLGIHFMPQLSYSFSSYGQIYRPGLVLEYNLIDKISFNSMLEYSYFQYSRQNVQFDAKKASVSFGINYHL